MSRLLTSLSEFIINLRAQKLRVFLTVFGIIWGTVAIVVLLAFSEGFKTQMGVNMHGLGESITIMFPGRTTKAYEGFGIGRDMRFVEEDAKYLSDNVNLIDEISPEYSKWGTPIVIGTNKMQSTVTGIYPIYGNMRNVIPEAGGRFINDLDMQQRRRVAVLGDEVKKILFGSETDAIGKTIFVRDTPFMVIGVMQHKTQNSSYNSRDANRVFIPASTYSSVFGTIYVNNIIYKPKDPLRSEETGKEVRAALSKKYKFDKTDEDAVWIWDTAEQDKFFFYFFLAFAIFMGVIGSFTLGVAGIGVANIMYIVVQERIKEIGIKRAVGATRFSILLEFILETFFLVIFGSLIGFVLAYIIIQLLQFIPIKDFVGTPIFSPSVVMITTFVLLIIGFAAGLLPARKAANLNVVECLRQ